MSVFVKVAVEEYAKLLKWTTFCCMPVIIKFLVILGLISPNMTHVQGQEPQSSYMDGVTVKISEHYKPPPKISLPITYAQRLSLNKHLQDNMASYDFLIERRVKEQLESLKNFRKIAAENRKVRSERVQDAAKQREEEKKNEVAKQEQEVSPKDSSQKNDILQPTQVKCCNILTPIPLNSRSQIISNPVDKSPLNISDFEADTSSPFDNMELKTLNDMEELAKVLRSETTPTTSSVQAYNTYSASHSYYNSYLNSETHHTNSFIPNYAQPVPYSRSETLSTLNSPYSYPSQSSSVYNPSYPIANNTTTFKTVPDILRALEAKLENHHITDVHSKVENEVLEKKRFSVPILKKAKEELDDPFNTLPKHLQDAATMISTMGFPLPRVARACQLFGDDHKKVVEYLLAMSELMDLGFPEKDVSSALQQCNNDRDKALDKLIL